MPYRFDPLTLPAPAKLNLCLHILGRRADGYHRLQTAFQLLDRGDLLRFAPRPDRQITLSGQPSGLDNEHNLIWRAAQLLQRECFEQTPPFGVHIELDKRLPMGGGLGGGSSDAATTLLALNHLWGSPLTNPQLQQLGLKLGADVPVFVAGHSAWAEGVGERLTPMNLPERWYLILTPNCHVSTAEVFCHKDLTRDTPPITVAAFLEQGGKNDCEPLVRRLYPEVDKALIWLDKFANNATMSGTGASVFICVETQARAQELLEKAPGNYSGFIARGVNRSPVHDAIAQVAHHSQKE